MTRAEQRARSALIGGMAIAGISDEDIAAALCLKLGTVGVYRARQGVKPAKLPRSQTPRVIDMSAMYTHGHTLQQIGDKYGITRERVRQLLAGAGICAEQGGAHIRAFLNRKTGPRKEKFEARCLVTMGCSRDAYKELTGNKYRVKDVHAARFIRQRNNAKNRGIAWEMTFRQWWDIWQKSGHYADLKGIGTYCMARLADGGPYAANNVYICTFAQNAHDQYFSGKQRKKPIAIHVEPRTFGDSYFPDAVYGAAV